MIFYFLYEAWLRNALPIRHNYLMVYFLALQAKPSNQKYKICCHIAALFVFYKQRHERPEVKLLFLKSATIIQYTIKGRFMSR